MTARRIMHGPKGGGGVSSFVYTPVESLLVANFSIGGRRRCGGTVRGHVTSAEFEPDDGSADSDMRTKRSTVPLTSLKTFQDSGVYVLSVFQRFQ